MINHDSPNNSSTGRGFGLGLLIGGLAGIATYYLFGTEEGNKLKQKIIEEYEVAKTNIPDDLSQFLTHNQIVETEPIAATSIPEKNLVKKLLDVIKPNHSTNPTPADQNTLDDSHKRFFTKSGRKLN